MEQDPVELLRYMVSWASLGMSLILFGGTLAIRPLLGRWCFFFSLAFHAIWAIQALVICLVLSRGIHEEIEAAFASHVVFGGVTLRCLFAAMLLTFFVERGAKP